jgi:phosphate-selective porin OprO/OprP
MRWSLSPKHGRQTVPATLGAIAFCAVLATAATASGQTAGAGAATPLSQSPRSATPSRLDKIWTRFTEWYTSDTNAVIQQVLFTGRYQHDFVAIDADEGDLRESNVRRMRLGARVKLFRTFTLHTEVDVDPQERDPFYLRFTDAYLQWSSSSRFVLTVGKQGVPFTLDGATSSKELLTIDRSNLANNLWFSQEYLPGVSASGRVESWLYRGGVYSAGAMNREFGDFSGGYVTLALLGYDLGPRLGVKRAVVTGNYVYQRPDPDNTFTRQLKHVGSLNVRFEQNRWGLGADVSQGKGYFGQGDMRALMVMPFVNITSRLQAVGRYTIVDSDDPDAVRLATYESRLVSGRGDQYQELYLGGNYYIYGHKLKVQMGLHWADMNARADEGGAYSGLSLTTGLRVGW